MNPSDPYMGFGEIDVDSRDEQYDALGPQSAAQGGLDNLDESETRHEGADTSVGIGLVHDALAAAKLARMSRAQVQTADPDDGLSADDTESEGSLESDDFSDDFDWESEWDPEDDFLGESVEQELQEMGM
ncbi:hypothetical protein HYDPIDRAFT_170544 [Hydnomerulius pinastri MD-312]|uniref:Uncharacterized protein n=1 Tax=Hydnomerulius pinastri MD-312 TaxID=994086 RepID=A0A0C9W9L3_9AGAM|nr:hypothetical protein HYDPIDRAFT_170544 [Hydnomerulius pinastri MD-312]